MASNSSPFFSVIVPTYNSEKTIGTVLNSIRKQTIDSTEVEILVIDGGSTDNTLEIAKVYDVRILYNPQRLPEYAKSIGIQEARGKYIIKNDSDEELVYDEQLNDRMNFLLEHPEVKVLVADRMIPVGDGVATGYATVCGDPFTWFVYKTKGSVIETFRNKIQKEIGVWRIMYFRKEDVLPIADSGSTTVSLDYVKSVFSDDHIKEVTFACNISGEVILETGFVGVNEKDVVNHYSGCLLKTYLSKLRFRIINNLFNVEESGFSQRAETNEFLKNRGRLFILYALSILFPLVDSVRLCVKYADISFLLHFVYVYYVVFSIVFYTVRFLIVGKIRNEVYGEG